MDTDFRRLRYYLVVLKLQRERVLDALGYGGDRERAGELVRERNVGDDGQAVVNTAHAFS
jgi:hypothetical protein